MITIAKHFTFDAAHRLDGLLSDHKCSRLHGHTYEVELRLYGEPDEKGFLVDYQEIADAWKPVHDALDHRFLNEIPGLRVPSTEVLVVWIMDRLCDSVIAKILSSVRVSESSTTWAELSAKNYAAFRRSSRIMALLDG